MLCDVLLCDVLLCDVMLCDDSSLFILNLSLITYHLSLITFPVPFPHLCIKTSRTLMSLGDTPGMRLA